MFQLNPASGIPIYRQLVDQVKRLIAGGQLAPGDSLPSVRELAQWHAVNPMTISKAYSQLESEGVLVRLRGKPMQVASGTGGATVDPLAMLRPSLAQLVSDARQLNLDDAALEQALKDYLKEA